MTNPKEALITAKVCIEGENTTLFQKLALKEIQAAIPVAKLQQEAVELLSEINPYLTEETYRKIIDLRNRLEALKVKKNDG